MKLDYNDFVNVELSGYSDQLCQQIRDDLDTKILELRAKQDFEMLARAIKWRSAIKAELDKRLIKLIPTHIRKSNRFKQLSK